MESQLADALQSCISAEIFLDELKLRESKKLPTSAQQMHELPQEMLEKL